MTTADNKFSILASLTSLSPEDEDDDDHNILPPLAVGDDHDEGNSINFASSGNTNTFETSHPDNNINSGAKKNGSAIAATGTVGSVGVSGGLLSSSGLLSKFGSTATGGGLFDQLEEEEMKAQHEEEERRRMEQLAKDRKRIEAELKKEKEAADEAKRILQLEQEQQQQQQQQREERQRAAAAASAAADAAVQDSMSMMGGMQELSLNEDSTSLAYRPDINNYSNVTQGASSSHMQQITMGGPTPQPPVQQYHHQTNMQPLNYMPQQQQQHQQQQPVLQEQNPMAQQQQQEQQQTLQQSVQPQPQQQQIQQAGYGASSYYYSTTGNVQQIYQQQPSPITNGNGNTQNNGLASSSYAQRSQILQQSSIVTNNNNNMTTAPTSPASNSQHVMNNGGNTNMSPSPYMNNSTVIHQHQHQHEQNNLQPQTNNNMNLNHHHHPNNQFNNPNNIQQALTPKIKPPPYNPNDFKPVFGPITVTDPILVQSPGVFSGPPHWIYTVVVRDMKKVDGQNEFSPIASNVRRRFRHFVALEDRLRVDCLGAILPPRPDKHTTRALDEASARQSTQFALQRARELETYLNALRLHPLAGQSPTLRLFLTLPDHIGAAWPEVSSSIFTRITEVGTTTAVKLSESTAAVMSELNNESQIMAGEDNSELLGLASAEGMRIGSVLQAVPKIEGFVTITGEQGERMSVSGLEIQKLVNNVMAQDREFSAPFEALSTGLLRSGRRTSRLAVELGAAAQAFTLQYKLCRYERMAFADRRSALVRRQDARRAADKYAQKLVVQQHSLQSMGRYGMMGGMGREAHMSEEVAADAVNDAEEIGQILRCEVGRITDMRKRDWSMSLRVIAANMREAHGERVAIWESCRTAFLAEHNDPNLGGGQTQTLDNGGFIENSNMMQNEGHLHQNVEGHLHQNVNDMSNPPSTVMNGQM